MTLKHFGEPLATHLEKNLMLQHGPIVSNQTLSELLGYPSRDAFRQAVSRGTIPIPIFDIENRKGKFALITDVAAWLADQRERAVARSDAGKA